MALRTGTEVLGPEKEADVFAGHTPGQLAVWIPEHRTLIAADALASHDGHPIVGVLNIDPEQAAPPTCVSTTILRSSAACSP